MVAKDKKSMQSLLITLLIISLLVFSGPATAVQVSLSSDVSTLIQNEVITFTAVVDLSDLDQNIPIQSAHLEIVGPSPRTFLFDPFTGKVTSGNVTPNEVTVSVSGDFGSQAYGYGYGYVYDYGYGSGWQSFGYGYGHSGPKTVTYTIMLNTSQLVNGTYQANVAINAGGKIIHSPLTSFTVLPRTVTQTTVIPPLTNGSTPTNTINTSLGTVYYQITANGTTPAVRLNLTITMDNPTGGALPSGAIPNIYYNFSINDTSWFDNVTIHVRFYYNQSDIPSGVDESTLRPLRWTSGSWVRLTGAMTLSDGTVVYGAGVDQGNNYVWANLSHFSVYGVGGTIPSPPAPSRGGGGVITRLAGENVLVVANSIDSALATDFLAYLESNNIAATIVNSTEFDDFARVENRIIIILGGPDAYEGVGEITQEVLTDSEEAAVRSAGAQTMYTKYNVWTDRYSYNQVVIVLAGSDRDNTQAAETKYQTDVETKVLG